MLTRTHPKFINYEFNSDGKFKLKGARIWREGRDNTGIKMFSIGRTPYTVHDAIWETFQGPIPSNSEVYHRNKNELDNRLINLGLRALQPKPKQEHMKEIGKHAHERRRHIKSFDHSTGHTEVFKSKNQAGKFFGVSASLIYHYLEHETPFERRYTFEYTTEQPTKVYIDARVGKKRVLKTDEEK